jgi:hypothetical protein
MVQTTGRCFQRKCYVLFTYLYFFELYYHSNRGPSVMPKGKSTSGMLAGRVSLMQCKEQVARALEQRSEEYLAIPKPHTILHQLPSPCYQ